MNASFPKKEKLKSKKLIDNLFIEGQSIKGYPFRLVYLQTTLPKTHTNLQIGFSVPKRNHKLAVTRNRIKRLLREAYRKNKGLLDTKGTTFAVLIIYTAREILPSHDVERKMNTLLKKFQDEMDLSHS